MQCCPRKNLRAKQKKSQPGITSGAGVGIKTFPSANKNFNQKKTRYSITAPKKKMQRTTQEVAAHLPKVLAALAIGYVTARSRRWVHIAVSGEFESCLHVTADEASACLPGACGGGHDKLAVHLMNKGAKNVSLALLSACDANHLPLVTMLIYRGVQHLNLALEIACQNGHVQLARYLQRMGGNCEWGLKGACRGCRGADDRSGRHGLGLGTVRSVSRRARQNRAANDCAWRKGL
jgi:hypothetical protein